MTLSEIADILHTTPFLKDSSVQEHQGSETLEDRGGDGVLKHTDTKRTTVFSVYLASHKTGLFRFSGSLAESLHTAFRDLHAKDSDVKMPDTLKKALPFTFPKKSK